MYSAKAAGHHSLLSLETQDHIYVSIPNDYDATDHMHDELSRPVCIPQKLQGLISTASLASFAGMHACMHACTVIARVLISRETIAVGGRQGRSGL
jgi:hypothetical protein